MHKYTNYKMVSIFRIFHKISHIPCNTNHFDTTYNKRDGKSILQVPDTGTRVLDNTTLFLRSSIVSFWITLARSKERKYHIFSQYWYTRNVPVFTNTGTFQYLGPEVYFFQRDFKHALMNSYLCFSMVSSDLQHFHSDSTPRLSNKTLIQGVIRWPIESCVI